MAKKEKVRPTSFDCVIKELAAHGTLFVPPGASISHCGLAAMLGLSHRSVVENMIYAGLPCRKVGHGWWIRAEAISEWIKSGEQVYGRRNPKS